MNRLYLFCFLLGLTATGRSQQTAGQLIEQIVQLQPRVLVKYEVHPKNNVLFLQTGFNDAVFTDARNVSLLKGKVIIKAELIYTTYRKSETFDQHGLNRRRLRAVIDAAPQLLTQPGIEWGLFAQSGCTSPEEGKDYYHGLVITYREPESAALRDVETAFLKAVVAGEVPSHAYDAFVKNTMKNDTSGIPVTSPKVELPQFRGGERTRIDYFTRNLHAPANVSSGGNPVVPVQFIIDNKGKIRQISLSGIHSPDAYEKEVERFVSAMPDWTPGSVNGKPIDCLVTFSVHFSSRGATPSPLEIYAMNADSIPGKRNVDYTRVRITPQSKFVSETLSKNAWKDAALVCDVTGSMAPYSAQVIDFLKSAAEKKDTAIVRFLFFNDGDSRNNRSKRIGSTGGIYSMKTGSIQDVLALMVKAMEAGSGGDLPENNIEALLQAEKECPDCQSTIHIADNMATPRDLALMNRLTKPVHVIVCGTSPVLNPAYLDLARATKGSIHFGNRDYTDLHRFEDGSTIQVGREIFMLKNGKFIQKM